MALAMDHESSVWMLQPQKSWSKDHVSGHKLALLVLVREYCRVKTRQQCEQGGEAWSHTNQQCRDFAITALKLLQSPDMSLSQLVDRVRDILHPRTFDLFTGALKTLYEGGVASIMDYIPQLDTLLSDPQMASAVLHKSSVLGLFVRRMLLALDMLNFSSLMKLHYKFKDYYQQAFGEASDSRKPDRYVTASQKQADYFLAKQVALMHLNEKQALPPPELQRKIRELQAGNPDLSGAQYVSFLNCLAVKEYCGAIESLHRHFDKNVQNQEGAAKGAQDDATKNLRFAALNLAMLHFKFGHVTEALTVLREAITLAQDSNDNAFLHHALTWMSRMQGSTDTNDHVLNSTATSSELGLWQIVSLGIQALARREAERGSNPAATLELLSKGDELNVEHSMTEPMGTSLVSRAALWNLYGFNRMGILQSQLLLHLTWVDPLCAGGVQPIGEATCVALQNLATSFSLHGELHKAFEVLKLACTLFPQYSDIYAAQRLCQLVCSFEAALHGGDWPAAERLVGGIHVLDSFEGDYYKARLLLWQEHFREALLIVEKLSATLSNGRTAERQFKGSVPHFLGRLYTLEADIFIEASHPVAALPVLSQAMAHAEQHHMAYLRATVVLRTAEVQLRVGLPKQAKVLLEGIVVLILGHGGLEDVGRLSLLMAKCELVAEDSRDLDVAVKLASRALDCFKMMGSNRGVRDSAYWLALICDAAGMEERRNEAAQIFRRTDCEMAEKLLYVV